MKTNKIKVNGIEYNIEDLKAQESLSILNGTGVGSVHQKVNDAIASAASITPETFETMQSVSSWLNNSGDVGASLVNQVNETPNITLRTLYIAAGAEYNSTDTVVKKTYTIPTYDTSHYETIEVQHLPNHYYLNGLGDITEKQMLSIFSAPKYRSGGYNIYQRMDNSPWADARTFFFRGNGTSVAENFNAAFMSNSNLEILFYDYIYPASNSNNMFLNCNKLKRILPSDKSRYFFAYSGISESAFKITWGSGAPLHPLEEIRIFKLRKDGYFGYCNKLSKNSVRYKINTSDATTPITITLHPDVYSKLINDTDVIADLENKNATISGSISLVSA